MTSAEGEQPAAGEPRPPSSPPTEADAARGGPLAKAESAEHQLAEEQGAEDQALRWLTPRSLPLPRLPRWVLYAAAVGAGCMFLSDLVGLSELAEVCGVPIVVSGLRTGVWLEQLLYIWMSRRPAALRLVLVGTLPVVGILGVILGGVGGSILGELDQLLGLAPSGPLQGAFIAMTLPAGFWIFGASLGAISVTFIDVVVSTLVRGFRPRITLAVGMLLGLLSTVVGLFVYAGDAMRANVAAGRSPTERWRVDAEDASSQAMVTELGEFFTEHPQFITLAAVGVGLLVGLPSVISACTKLADAVLERILPLMHAFDAVATGARRVRVEEAGSTELTELARHFNRMLESVDNGERMERAFGLYVGDKLLDRIRDAHGDGRVEAATKDATVWFADIRGFTTLSEQLPPETVVEVLNRYFDRVLEVIDAHDGFLDKFIGDAVVVVFNGPVDQPNHATRATRCAVEMLQAVNEMNARNAFPEIGALYVGAGVNSGSMVAGNIGSSRKVEYTVIGDAVNLASRVEGMTKLYGAPLLVTAQTRARLEDNAGLTLRHVDRVAAKGKAEPVDLYEVLEGHRAQQRELRAASLDAYATAFDAYLQGHFDRAAAGFADILARNDGDTAAERLHARCLDLAQHDVPHGWDGVLRMNSK